MRLKSIIFFFGLLLAAWSVSSQSAGIHNSYIPDTALPRLRIERAMIDAPGSAWLYNHHASITKFKGRLFACWSDGMKDEDAPGQRVLFSTSKDFHHWSAPQVLAAPAIDSGGQANVLTAAGFHSFGDTLVAYYGSYSAKRRHTRLWARVSTDGPHWSSPLDMKVPVNPNHGPQWAGKRLIISGNFTFPYTDDPRGLTGWTMSTFYPDSIGRLIPAAPLPIAPLPAVILPSAAIPTRVDCLSRTTRPPSMRRLPAAASPRSAKALFSRPQTASSTCCCG